MDSQKFQERIRQKEREARKGLHRAIEGREEMSSQEFEQQYGFYKGELTILAWVDDLIWALENESV